MAFGLTVCVDGVGCVSQHADFVRLQAGSLCVDGVVCVSQHADFVSLRAGVDGVGCESARRLR